MKITLNLLLLAHNITWCLATQTYLKKYFKKSKDLSPIFAKLLTQITFHSLIVNNFDIIVHYGLWKQAPSFDLLTFSGT